MTKSQISAGLLALTIVASVVLILTGHVAIGAPILTGAVGVGVKSPVYQ
jgi:uncharacterized membrane protein